MSTNVPARQRQRIDTAVRWTQFNPVLLDGEMGIERDTGRFKFGNGTTAWISLPYAKADTISQNSESTSQADFQSLFLF
jgi:hypothetical protein